MTVPSTLGSYEQQAIRTVERLGLAVLERPTSSAGCWVAWHYDLSYPQDRVRVFSTELEALRWVHREGGGAQVTFVPWGSCASEVEAAPKTGNGDYQ